MSRVIDLSKTVLELSQQVPEFIEIMKELGFQEISNPAMLKTAGRFMTLPKGAKLKGIPMERIREAFEKRGYQLQ